MKPTSWGNEICNIMSQVIGGFSKFQASRKELKGGRVNAGEERGKY